MMKTSGRQGWELTPERFLNPEEIRAVLIRAEELKELGIARKRPQLVRDWMILLTFICTGLRRFEVTELRCTDFRIFGGNSFLVVRRGKGGRSRRVHLPKQYKKAVGWYLRWKAERDEILDSESYFLRSERSEKYSPSGIYKRWKKYVPNHRLHDARHTCATALYDACNNLRIVQKTLGHRSLSSTQVYADVSVERMQAAMTDMEKNLLATKRPHKSRRSIAPLIDKTPEE